MKRMYIAMLMGILFAFNNVFAQSTQENVINTASLNTVMNQGYEFRGIVGNCIVVEKGYMCGILKTNGQWLIKPLEKARARVLHNVIMYENSYEKAEKRYEDNVLYDGNGKELIRITFTDDMSKEECTILDSKYQLELFNKLFENENKITELEEFTGVRHWGINEEKALKDGYLIARDKVLDKNGKLVFESGISCKRYCGKGVFYLEDKNGKAFFASNLKEKSLSALNSFLERGFKCSESEDFFGDCITLYNGDESYILDAEGKCILGPVKIHFVYTFYNFMEVYYSKNENEGDRCLIDRDGNIKQCNNRLDCLLGLNMDIQDIEKYGNNYSGDCEEHIIDALEDGYLIFKDPNKGVNAVLDKNGKIRTQSDGKIFYCGNGLFAVERAKDRYSFTLIK